MKITKLENGKIAINTPYNPDFITRIKEAGGRWNPGQKVWETDERFIETVRVIMREVYGQDDLPQETVTIKVNVGEFCISVDKGPIVLFGRIIASAWGRDSGARVGKGVSFEKGKCRSGGSMKNWDTIIDAGSIFTIYDVPKMAAEQKLGWQDDFYSEFEVIENGDGKKALRAEKEVLLRRLAEIEELLND